MPRKRFMSFNIIASLLWGAGITMLGYWFGSKVPNLEHYIQYVLIGVILLSLGFSLLHLLREEKIRHEIWLKIKKNGHMFTLNK